MSVGANAVLLTLGAGATQRSLWLEYNIDAICVLEELLDLDAEAIERVLQNPKRRIGQTRALLYAALVTRQPGFTVPRAGELLLLKGREQVGPAMIAAWNKAFAGLDADDEAGAGGEAGRDADVPPDPAGTGPGSSDPGSPTA